MAHKNNHLPPWLKTNAWREIISRIFAQVESKPNVYPGWLVNPATNRRLKLDLLYPEIGVAIRFEGQQPKQRRQRPSLQEEEQQQTRHQARIEVCQAHGINLIIIDPTTLNPKDNFQTIDMMLSRAARRKPRARPQIRQARAKASDLARRLQSGADLKLYADLWEDRQYQLREPGQPPTPPPKNLPFETGMEVEHTLFGPGHILAITPDGDETLITVDFINAGQKTLAASLVTDKLHPRTKPN